MLADSAGSRRAEWTALGALAVLYYAVPWHALGTPAAVGGAPVVFLLLVAVPGLALLRLSGLRPRDAFESLTLVSMFGLCLALLGCFVWALWGVSIDVFRFGFPVVAIALALVAPRRHDARLPLDRERVSRRDGRLMLGFAAVMVVVAAILWVSGPTTYTTTDTIDHTAYVGEIARTGQPFPHTAFYKDPGDDGADLRKSLLHCLFGVYERHLGAGPLAIFAFLGAVQLIILCLSIYTAALWMFARRDVALLSAFIFLLVYDGGISGKAIRVMFYPNRFGTAPLLLFAAAAMRALGSRGRRDIALCAVFGFTAAAVHVQYIVFTAVAAGIVVVWKTCSPAPDWGRHLRRSIAAGSAAGLAILPYAAYRVVTSYQTSELHDQVQGAVFVVGNWFVAEPLGVWHSLGWTGLAAILGIVPLWGLRKRVPGVGYGIASLVSVLLVVFNPFVLPVVFRAISYLAFRLMRVAPFYMLAAFLVVTLVDGRARRDAMGALGTGVWRRWMFRAASALAVVAVLAGVVRFGEHHSMLFASSEAEKRISYERWAEGLSAVAGAIPPGSVIASDPVTSYYASAFTPDYVLCTLDQHAPPNDRHADARMAAARDILSPYTSLAQKVAVIAARGVTHVVVNEDIPHGLVLNYWTLDPDLAARARRAFDARPDVFEKVVSEGAITAYRWTGVVPADAPVATPVVSAPPRDATAVGARSGEATIAAARLGASRLVAGDTLGVDVYWTRSTPAPTANYVVSIRLDRVGLQLPLGGRPFPKIARKIKERLDGVLYRYRADHTLLRGFYGPDLWPRGAIVRDHAVLRIPSALAPGTYTVQARMRAVAASPNTDLRSFFFDDDLYSGVEIGRVVVSAE